MIHAQSFDSPLPRPEQAEQIGGFDQPEHYEVAALSKVAEEISMTPESPVLFHRTQPHCPVPGRAIGILRGPVSGASTTGRLGFFVLRGHTGGSYRVAMMLPSLPGAETPLGGVLDRDSDHYVEVTDGVAYIWPRTLYGGELNPGKTLDVAVPTLARLGFVAGS